MNEFENLGFFDFEDFVSELSDEQLIAVNGGACGGGGAVTPSTPHYSGSCSGGGAVTSSPSPSYSYPTPSGACGGGLPPKQICTAPNKTHCDIYAWNLAIDHGVDPRLGKGAEMDLNIQTVDTMYNSYYKGKEASFSSKSAGKKGMIVYDWGGTSPAKDHIEYVEIAADGKGYYLYATKGILAPVKEYSTFKDKPTAKANTANGSSMVFIPLN